ncbi:MAG TPA: hypothetical protein VGI70_16200, partial [Polyangiales bacterium]
MPEPMGADQIRVSQLIAIALGCACAGLGSVYWIANPLRDARLTTTLSAASEPASSDDGESIAALPAVSLGKPSVTSI